MNDYMTGYRSGAKFVERYRDYPQLVMRYAHFHINRYRQTESDNGFIDAVIMAYGG